MMSHKKKRAKEVVVVEDDDHPHLDSSFTLYLYLMLDLKCVEV